MIAIVGGGPAGLRAAEVAAAGGAEVTVFDAKASVGRKFLVAGGGGLNITKAEEIGQFAAHYRGPDMPAGLWEELITEFGPAALRAWAADLGIETFVASTRRVYPKEMKAAPLLRRWVQRLRGQGVRFAMHHRWTGWRSGALEFATPEGRIGIEADAAVLAMGGGSWPETGSDGDWIEILRQYGVPVAPLSPANCGWGVDWPPELVTSVEGKPIKNIVLKAGGEEAAGELMVTRHGLEGGAIYQLGAALRHMDFPEVEIDFKPALTLQRVIEKLGPAKRNLVAEAAQRLKLGEAARALLEYHPRRGDWMTVPAMAEAIKSCRVPLTGSRPLAEAISSAGGVGWSELDEWLMVRRCPGVFVAGEMMDWEAPTGGYLMQGCFATGTRAAQGALRWQQCGKMRVSVGL